MKSFNEFSAISLKGPVSTKPDFSENAEILCWFGLAFDPQSTRPSGLSSSDPSLKEIRCYDISAVSSCCYELDSGTPGCGFNSPLTTLF